MDAGKLFSELVNRPTDQSGGILTGTAVSDSVDGTVMVQMDGSVVAQPGEDEVTLTVSADDFVDGSYVLPSVPYAGSLTITDSGGNELEEQDYELDGARLTIFALSSSPVDIAYQTQVQQQITNDDFDGDRYSLASTTNLSVEEMASDGSWSPATYMLDGNILTIAGIEHQAGIVEFTYVYDVSQVCEPGENVLPDSPDEVSVLGRNSSGVDVVVTDYVLDGNVITLPSTYDAYTVDYPVTTTEEWNVSDQYQEEPLEDSDDAADPAIVTIGHNLQWPPASVVSCTIDGVAATYTLDDVNVVVDAPAVTERWFRLTYDAPVSLQVPASVFATGAFTLPSVPLGSVSTVRAGIVLENVVDDDQLTIASLVVDSPTYSIAYTEQVEQDAVELPCTPYVAEGQFVEIAVVNGMPTVIGASGSGDVTMTLAGDAADAAAAAEDAAEAAQAVADRVSEHFWTDVDGVHVTEVTQEEWQTSPTGSNQLSNSAGILLRDGTNPIVSVATGADPGMSVFDGAGSQASNVMATFTGSGVTLGRAAETHVEIDPYSLQLVDEDNNTYFMASDLRGEDGYISITEEFTSDGFLAYYDLKFTIASNRNITVTVGGTATTEYQMLSNVIVSPYAPDQELEIETVLLDNVPAVDTEVVVTYDSDDDRLKAYSLGLRHVDGYVAPMSVAEGYITIASGVYSHAEGNRTTARGDAAHSEGFGGIAYDTASHVEGYRTTARGLASHAEGNDTHATVEGAHSEGALSNASRLCAHAEGWGTTASGLASHSQNRKTIASGDFQTALGKFNVADTTSAVIIGNGTADDARSNALTVDWSGNVTTAGDVSATGGTFTGTVSADSATLANPLPKASGGTGHTRGLHWQGQGSTSGTGTVTVDLANWDEVCIVATANGKLVTAVVPTNVLTSSTQELWLGGGKSANGVANAGNLRAVVNISLTTVKGVDFSEGSTNRTSSARWRVYAR